jgi:hypothetical protein
VKVIRLTAVAHVIHYWDFLAASLQSISDKVREPFDEDFVRKTLVNLVVDHNHAWVGITINNMGEPLAFGCAQECTPAFSKDRYFVVRWFYHSAGKFEATVALMTGFEQWAKDRDIKYYAVTTKRSAGEAIKCFSSARYGFKKAFLTFEKQLS